MKLTQGQILKIMIENYELKKKYELSDPDFDAWNDIAEHLGLKSTTTLRKWCGPKHSLGNTKMGYDDAIKIMARMNDYRLLDYMKESLIERKNEEKQLEIFSKPHSEL